MSSLWTFSPSSEPYLQRCVAAAPPPDPNNKWFRKFGKEEAPVESVENIEKTSASDSEDGTNELETDSDSAINCDVFFDTIESESNIPIEFVVQECKKNTALFTQMAQKLSSNKVEELFKHIFGGKPIQTEFLTPLITKFLPMYIKLQYSRICIDLLVKINEKYAQLFRQLLEILINDLAIPNQVLNNYVAVLNKETVTDFIKTISKTEICTEGFLHNLSVIYTAYKDCIKTDTIQNFFQSLIIQHSTDCAMDRNFGRLFLAYLQAEKSMDRKVNVKLLEECLECHRSPFKRPCAMVLEEIDNE